MIKRLLQLLRIKPTLADIANRNDKRYIKWLTSYAPDYASGKIELKRVYTDKEGVNFYVPTDLLMYTKERYTKIIEAQISLDYGMSRTELQTFLEETLTQFKDIAYEQITKDKLKRFIEPCKMQMEDFLYRVKHIKSEKALLEVALLLFFIEGEDPYTVNELTQQRKREKALSDDNLRAFFLQTALILLKQSKSNENDAIQGQ